MNASHHGVEVSDHLGLANALRALPAAAALPKAAFQRLHLTSLDVLVARLSARLTAQLDDEQMAEYSAAAQYQQAHPGTGEHTRAWLAANLVDPHDALPEELRRVVQEAATRLGQETQAVSGNP